MVECLVANEKIAGSIPVSRSTNQLMQTFILNIIGFLYKYLVRKILFLINPEVVHRQTIAAGQLLGESKITKKIISPIFQSKNASLQQSLFGCAFNNPVGLAAGFDYEARLTQILPSLGFGFGTAGTITYLPYDGNPRPMLGRLPRSRSLMVNKGLKNLGVADTLKSLKKKTFEYPVGISIGKTNTVAHKTTEEAVNDVARAFEIAETSGVPLSYYELNISCPNLISPIDLYSTSNLKILLDVLSSLHFSKPVFIKMPISKSDDEIKKMMDLVTQYHWIKAVILGNLQHDRNHPSLMQKEVKKFAQGSFSGLPCQNQSDRLVSLVHKEYGQKIKIIGCGGIFSAQDAYRKIKLGASLVQLITGLVFEGPQLISQINQKLVKLLKQDGYASIKEAVGTI